MTDIGVPGSPDGPPQERATTGELVLVFHDTGRPDIKVPTIPGRSHREVVGEAAKALIDLMNGDVLDRLGEGPGLEPPH